MGKSKNLEYGKRLILLFLTIMQNSGITRNEILEKIIEYKRFSMPDRLLDRDLSFIKFGIEKIGGTFKSEGNPAHYTITLNNKEE